MRIDTNHFCRCLKTAKKIYNYINIYLRPNMEYYMHHMSLKLEIKQEMRSGTELTKKIEEAKIQH